MMWLDWNLISSSACRLVGSDDADEQALAALEQRQRLVLADQILADEAQRNLRQVERLDVEQRNAELRRRGQRDLDAADETVISTTIRSKEFGQQK